MRQLFGALILFLLACPTLFARGVGEWSLGERGDTLRCALPMGSDSQPTPEGRLPRANEIRVLLPVDTLSSCKKPKALDGLWKVDFSAYGLFPRRQKVENRWRNIPEDCRIDWRRKRERPVWDFLMDVATFFNTFDTTYVQRDRYAAQVQLYNTHFLQLIRLTGSDAEGHSQSLVFSPAHTVKIGPYVTWHGVSLGYAFGVVPDRYGSSATEWTVAAYNSKVGFDFSYVASRGNFNLLRVSGIEGVDNAQIKEVRFPAMRTHTLAVNAYYVFNYRHFSYPAAFSLSTVQLRSAGSWLLAYAMTIKPCTSMRSAPSLSSRAFRPRQNSTRPCASTKSTIGSWASRSVMLITGCRGAVGSFRAVPPRPWGINISAAKPSPRKPSGETSRITISIASFVSASCAPMGAITPVFRP